MMQVLRRGARGLEQLAATGAALPGEALWVDLLEPTPEEVGFVERELHIEMPTREEMREIEASSRVYEESEGLFMTATLPVHSDTPPPGTTEISFIIVNDRLVTLRFADPQPFRSVSTALARQSPLPTTSAGAFFWILDRSIARLADILERASYDVDSLSNEIFRTARLDSGEERPDLLRAIERVGRIGVTNAKVRESLHTLQRVLLAVSVSERLAPAQKKEMRKRAKELTRDVQSLTDHSGFLAQKTNFLLDATLGMINIEQNAIIKIFSVVAVVFLPPTLIASIYGMNFDLMPELHWPIGYPFAVLLMVISAILPYLYFKRRGWL